MKIQVVLAVLLAGLAGYWWGRTDAEPANSPQGSGDLAIRDKEIQDGPGPLTTPARIEEWSPTPTLPPEAVVSDVPVKDERFEPLAAVSVGLPLGCYLRVEDMPEDLRSESERILGEVPEGKYQLFHFGDRELHTSLISPVPDSPEAYSAVADLVDASSVVKVLRAEFIEEAERRGEVTRFGTLEEARAFSESERNLIVSSSSAEGFIVVDLTDLFARRDYSEAIELQEACRDSVFQSQLQVTTYGYTR